LYLFINKYYGYEKETIEKIKELAAFLVREENADKIKNESERLIVSKMLQD
jgi:hypothetical protein